MQASCVRQPETFHQRGDQVTAQTISEWLKKQMGAGGIPAHNMKAHSSFTDGDRFVNWRSALPVVDVAQLDRAPLVWGVERYSRIITWSISCGWPDVIWVRIPAPQPNHALGP